MPRINSSRDCKIVQFLCGILISGMMFAIGSSARMMAQRLPSAIVHSPALGVNPIGTTENALERQKYELERQKLADETAAAQERNRIEWAKLEFERSNAYRTVLSSMVPLLVALGTLAFSIWSFRKQAQLQTAMQLDTARLQFEVKAAEIAFAGKTPEAVRNRGRALKAMFTQRLPPEFASSFDPAQHGAKRESPEEKKVLLELLVKYPSQEREIFELWSVLFGDPWLERVEPLIGAKNKVASGGGAVPDKGHEQT